MKHCFIAPTNYLHLIPKESKHHLLLAHLLEDKKYVEFYKKRKQEGDFIFLDNGAFEFKRPLMADELIRLVDKAGFDPDVIVAPDYPFEPWEKTVQSTEDFCKIYRKYFGDQTVVMAVPQSIKGDHEGWIQSYNHLQNIEDVWWIGMSILGIPNAFCSLTGTEDISFNRTFCTELLKKNHFIKPQNVRHHYLGCGDPRELLMMKAQGVANTNDSSTAFWHGIVGTTFDDSASGLIKGKSPIEVDFDIDFEESNVQRIRRNIDWINKLICSI